MTGSRRSIGLLTLGLSGLLFTACGPMPAAEPTPAAVVETAEEEVTLVEEALATPATPSADTMTLGALAERVSAAWTGVSSYRVTFIGGPATATPAAGTPVATPVEQENGSSALESVREVVLPNRQRQIVSGAGGDDHEAILVDDRLYLRGPLAAQLMPGAAPETWIALDPARIAPGSRLAVLLGGLPRLPIAPLSTVPERLWPQELRDLGEVVADGQTCRAYAAADTVTATGMRVDFTIAIDENDLPCFIETTVGGTPRGREEYSALNEAIEIVAPTAATPVAAIPVALATPLAHG